jgi:hypothetical protein
MIGGWLMLVLVLAMAAGAVIIVLVGRKDEQRREERRRRFELKETGERIPLVPEKPASPPGAAPAITEIPLPPPVKQVAEPAQPRPEIEPGPGAEPTAPVITGRIVQTPDGEALLTTPPFKLRPSIFSLRSGRYALALLRRLPPWLVVAPRVRLDTVLIPTSPDGRDAADWREWRRRVRVRCIDVLICDRRDWKPILAILFGKGGARRARSVGGGVDRIVDEVLTEVSLPFLRVSGVFREDWPLIRPYIEQATLASLPHRDEDALHGGQGWDASAAVTLLRMDDERGGLLE